MLYSTRTLPGMGAPSLPTNTSRHFPQWSRTAILTITNKTEDEIRDVKKASPDATTGGFLIGGSDATARVAHLEHSVRFLQEQHRLMLSGLHAEIEALRERNRDLQFQLIFNKEATPKLSQTEATPTSTPEETTENVEECIQETNLRREVSKLEKEAAAARGEARAAEARAVQLQRIIEAQTEKIRTLELRCASDADACPAAGEAAGEAESRAELRARLADAERLVRRLRGDAERQRREVLAAAGGVTNLLFDGAAARHAHLQCMKNSLHASLRASGLDSYGYQNHYAFPPVHTPEFWREPLREEYSMGGSRGRSNRRPITLPELSAVGQPIHRSTVYANPHARSRGYGYEKPKKTPTTPNGEASNGKSLEEPPDARLSPMCNRNITKTADRLINSPLNTYPELKIVVTKIISHDKVTSPSTTENGRQRPRRHHHRKHTDHT
ncbi:uncharacterized protein [Epargyreus clarus]|uniref:uncharacterized protein isoform X3 n=1 Tax=Epargyreus clarus TaxID=520877 RepID=UPI003C301A69